MNKILVIESYLSKENSLAAFATEKFVNEYKKINPNDQIIFLDLNKEEKLQKILTANNFNSFWDSKSEEYIDLFLSCQKIIISTGMINFSISPILKNFFDNILKANRTFKYKYDGKDTSEGLANPETKVQLIMAQGSYKDWYKFSAFDDYLISILNFMGIVKINLLLFDGGKTKEQSSLSIEEKFNLKKEEFGKLVKKF